MALHVTQCPRCESTFNTSARMLEAAHGLVRCGACLSIFEADQHFVDPLPDASNDENGHPTNESVFISAPEEYFDPADFLNHEEQAEDEAFEDDEGELLYAKSDVHDSSFDVFDVDPEVEDSKVHEQILDSDFDVFDVDEIKRVEEPAKDEVQDNEFDIYDAGERVLTRRPDSPQGDGDEAINLDRESRHHESTDDTFQLKASFSFSPGMPQAIFVPAADAVTAEPAATVDGTGLDPLESKDQSEKTLPPELADDPVVILPQGPDATTLLKALQSTDDSEVILPPGPDAATLLAELKEANEQSINEDEREESDLTEHNATEEGPSFVAEQANVDEIEAIDGAEEDFDYAIDDFSEALSDGVEWEEADLEVDESSFVILPDDPYKPSAFLHLADEQAEQSLDAATEIDEIEELEEIEQREESAREGDHSKTESPALEAPDRQTAAATEVPTLTDFVTAADGSAVENDGEPEPGNADGNAKDVIRSHVMATEMNEQEESLEQLSEENLRAVRDVDTALELEQRNQKVPTRAGFYLVGGLVLVLLSSLVFFWLRMPQLSQDPRLRIWYQTACNLVGCTLPDYVNPDQVETSNLVVRSHPQRDNTLELTAVFRNSAQFPQPFPLIELTFSDLTNRPMMVFEFLPDEYLPQALRGMPLMPVGAPVQITLDLADPGSDAVNYQMTYKTAPPRPRQ